MEINNIYCMDCVDGMKKLESEVVDLTVTSPPYDALRDYKGFSWDYKKVAEQLFRVTKPGGVVVWVVGDATVDGSETGNSFRR
jgi:DNA modification methylase